MSKKGITALIVGFVFYFGILISIPIFVSRSIPDPYDGVLVVESDSGQGSGFIVARYEGYWYMATAAHVVDNESGGYYDKPIFDSVYTVDSELYEAEILSMDRENDVALLRFQSPENYRIYTFGKVQLGQSCSAVGWRDDTMLVFQGHIVSINMDGFVIANGGVIPGCSGGVLLNADGEAIGVTVRVHVERGGYWDSTAKYVPIRFVKALLVAEGLRD